MILLAVIALGLLAFALLLLDANRTLRARSAEQIIWLAELQRENANLRIAARYTVQDDLAAYLRSIGYTREISA